ncbi:MAG: DNA repair protein RadA, partial [Deltaproteobacteria bacterium]|nr:DNA repair protein RadA [Deltaproteobacteria bacterium]
MLSSKKNKASFFCTVCGYQSAKWLGKCPGCEEWESMREAPTTETPVGAQENPQLLAVIEELGES